MTDEVEVADATSEAEVREALDTFKPDIIHQHGIPQFTPPSLGGGDGELPRIVLSPDGTRYSPSSLGWGRGEPYVLIARSPMEYERLKDLHPRVEIVRNPLITRTTIPADCARQHLRIYQRVLHSDVLPLLSDDSRHVLALLLKAAICGDRRWVTVPPLLEGDEVRLDFPRLYIYAEQEGVLPLLMTGLQLLGIEAPSKQPAESYLPADYQQPQPMPTATITELVTDLQKNGPTLLRLTETDRVLRCDSTDEAQLLTSLRSQKLLPFFSSILQLLSEQTLLDEGFMPCPPVDNHTTQQLRKQLRNRLKP